MREMHEKYFKGDNIAPNIHCNTFEDNMGALELTKTPKMRPIAKSIDLVYQKFRENVRGKLIKMIYIDSK